MTKKKDEVFCLYHISLPVSVFSTKNLSLLTETRKIMTQTMIKFYFSSRTGASSQNDGKQSLNDKVLNKQCCNLHL